MADVRTTGKENRDRLEVPQGGHEGFEVRDPRGVRIGKAKEVFLNGDDEPEYVLVRIGLLGPGPILIPVQNVAVDRARRVLTLG